MLSRRSWRAPRRALAVLLVAAALVVGGAHAAHAQTTDGPVDSGAPVQTVPAVPEVTTTTTAPDASINISLPDSQQKPSQSVLIILLLTVISVAPALLIMLTSFTR